MEDKGGKNTYVQVNDEYRLVFDSYCMWIEQKRISGKTGKERMDRVSGYCYTFADLIRSFEKHKTLEIDGIETLQQLAEKQLQMHEEIRELCKGLKDVSELAQDRKSAERN